MSDQEALSRRQRLIDQFGMPEHICSTDALMLVRTHRNVSDVTPDQVVAHVYRDTDAAEGWLEANRQQHGHPLFSQLKLPDGRVVGIMDLRPALARARESSALDLVRASKLAL